MQHLLNRAFINQISSFSSKLSLLEKKKKLFRENFPKASKKKWNAFSPWCYFNLSSSNYTTGQWCRVELPCGRMKTDAGLLLAFLLTWHGEAIYDDDISIPSHPRPADSVSTVLQAASCNLLVSMVLGYLCIKAYRVQKALARKRLHVGQQLWEAVEKQNKLHPKKSFLQLHDYRRGLVVASGWTQGGQTGFSLNWSLLFFFLTLVIFMVYFTIILDLELHNSFDRLSHAKH